jgi:hypothetical protein
MSAHESGYRPVGNVDPTNPPQGKVGASAPAPSGLSPFERIEYMAANIGLMQVTTEAKIDALIDLLVAKGILDSSDIEVINSDIGEALGEVRKRSVSNVGGDDS